MEVRAGYKQTEIGVIPEDWEQVNALGEIGVVTDRSNVSAKRCSVGWHLSHWIFE